MFIIYQNINHKIVALSELTKGLDMIWHVCACNPKIIWQPVAFETVLK